MDRRGLACVQGGGEFFHGMGRPRGGGNGMTKCERCGMMGRGPKGECSWGLQPDDSRRDSVELENPGLGHCRSGRCRQGKVGNTHVKEENNSSPNSEEEILNRLQELEMQVRMIRSENLECKNVLLCLYNLVSTNHTEVRAQKSNLAEKIEHLEDSLGLVFSRKAWKNEVTSRELEEINRKMVKLQKFMANAGNFVDLSAEKNGAAELVGAAVDIGLK